MLSILIPVYNYDITELVLRIHKEAKKLNIPFEIRILDDCSPSIKIEKSDFNRSDQIIYERSSQNLGRTATRQNLALKAKYNRLLFLDADVMPVKKDFIATFLKQNQEYDIIIGGTQYSSTCPDSKYSLRWKFDVKRESKNTKQRNKKPYLSIISQCLFIDKKVFLKVNKNLKNRYGMDILFSYMIKNAKLSVLHINNPIYHLGLETNEVFLPKSLRAIDTLIALEKDRSIPNNYSSLQKAYIKLKKSRLQKPMEVLLLRMKSSMEVNLTSDNPRLLYFDLYRLLYYLEQKK